MEKVVKKRKLSDITFLEDLEYWLSKSPEERISAVEYLRRNHYGDIGRIQKTVKVIQLDQK